MFAFQMAEIYNDSKTFVDKPLINPVDQVLHNFYVFMQVRYRLFRGNTPRILKDITSHRTTISTPAMMKSWRSSMTTFSKRATSSTSGPPATGMRTRPSSRTSSTQGTDSVLDVLKPLFAICFTF